MGMIQGGMELGSGHEICEGLKNNQKTYEGRVWKIVPQAPKITGGLEIIVINSINSTHQGAFETSPVVVEGGFLGLSSRIKNSGTNPYWNISLINRVIPGFHKITCKIMH